MGNNDNKKVPKKRKPSKKHKSRNSSDQKENVLKIPKNKGIKSDDGIAMSKQLLLKKSSMCSNRQSSSKTERVCVNGKPIPSLAELEKMFEDSDDDDQPLNASTKKLCETSTTPKKQTSESICNDKLLSPTTINKISERMLELISTVSDPTELLQDVPPPPVIPQKKRKKPDQPYIVGCKERPQVLKRSNNNFCKGDAEYGVQTSPDPEEPPIKRAKKSKIANYSKSIFNAKSDEIAERLNNDDGRRLSDASTDSNKTIEYNPTLLQSQRLHSFSPLPSTSKNNKIFIQNDELFSKSLMENDVTNISKVEETENSVNIIDIPNDVIVIDEEKLVEDEKPAEIQNTSFGNDVKTDVIEIIEDDTLENRSSQGDAAKCEVLSDNDDCLMIPSSANNSIQTNVDQIIDVDDEYSNINLDYDTFKKEPVEIIEIDDVIAENESILGKWKNDGTEKLNNINTVVDVPTTYRNSTTPQTTETRINHTLKMTNVTETVSQNNHSSQTLPNEVDVELVPTSTSTPNQKNVNKIKKIVNNFFKSNEYLPRKNNNNISIADKGMAITDFISICDSIIHSLQESPRRVSVNNVTRPVPSSQTFQNPVTTASNTTIVDLSASTDISEKQQTYKPPVQVPNSPVPTRNLGDCPICMDPLSTDGIASTICGHVFCLKCIKASIKVSGKRCPTCRKVLKGAGGGYHQLYL